MFTRLYFRLWPGQIILSASVTLLEATSTSGLIHGNLKMESDQVFFFFRIYKHFSGTVQLSGVKPATEEEELVYFERS